MDRRRIFPPRIVTTTVKAIVRVFSRAKRTTKREVFGERKKKHVSLVLHRFRKERNRGNLRVRSRKRWLTFGIAAVTDDQSPWIQILPDEILLEIFDCHRLAALSDAPDTWKWHRLAHVCQRWRILVFESPRRLDLRLVYTYKNPVRKSLDLWPVLPVSIWYPKSPRRFGPDDEENVLAALKHPDRICEINLSMTRQLLSKSAGSMQASFPKLQRLQLRPQEPIRPLVIPIGFLGGSTPLLRDIHLVRTAFPTLAVLLLSAQALVSLQLDDIPIAGYFSPEDLAISLGVMVRLETLKICFLPPNAHERSMDASPINRAMLPALTEFEFKGNCEYVEDLVSRIDAPALGQIKITFFEQPTFGIPRLARFIGRTKEAKSPHHTSVRLSEETTTITQYFRRPSCTASTGGTFQLEIPCEELDRQVPLLIHVCRYLSEPFAGVERFDIEAYPWSSGWTEGEEIDSTVWLELFRTFRGAKRFEVSGGVLVTSVASAFERATGEMARIVLPALRDLHLLDGEPSVSTSIDPFIAARLLCNRPVAVHYEKEGSVDHSKSEDD